MHPLKIQKLQVQNFRNLSSDIISFSSGINCIFGDNGNGKTNILEALYFIITRRSFRKNTSFPQFLSFNGENEEISLMALFEERDQEKKITYSGRIREKGGEWHLQGKPTYKKIEVGIIFINPFEGQAFHHTPSVRRNWVNIHLSQLDFSYKKNLKRYNEILKFRNSLLQKRPYQYRQQIKAIDSEMAPLAINISSRRRKFLEEIQPFVQKVFQDIFDVNDSLRINLESQVVSSDDREYLKMLEQNLIKDEQLRRTSYGVHRDDYTLLLNGLNSFDYASLGQQKMSYLSLLFAYIELFRYKFMSLPIVLLDDVSGELDEVRWEHLVNYLKKSSLQLLITTANKKFEKELGKIEGVKKILVKQGVVSQI